MKHFQQGLSIIAASVMLLGASACGKGSYPDSDEQQDDLVVDELAALDTADREPVNGPDINVEFVPYATAVFRAADGYRTSGNVQFMRPEGQSVRVMGRIANLPEGEHDLRILQSGDCRDITGLVSTRITEIESAVEDEGNAALPSGGIIATLSVGNDNLASVDVVLEQLRLEGPGSIVGKPIIIAPQTGQDPPPPGGNTTEAVACAVIASNDLSTIEDAVRSEQ